MKGKEYTKATVAADAAQTQQLTDESYYAKTWTDKKEKKLRRGKLRMSRSMMIFLVLDFLSIIFASFASILVRYEFQFDLIEQRFVDTIIWYMLLSRKLNDALSSRLFYAHFDSHRDISHFKSSCFCELFF